MVKIGINGFGRIGRLFLRNLSKSPGLQVGAINDLFEPEVLAYLLQHDTTYRTFKAGIKVSDRLRDPLPGEIHSNGPVPVGIEVNRTFIPCFAFKEPARIPWGRHDSNYVLESTGRFTDWESAKQHIQPDGAQRVVISAPTKDPAKVQTFVMGVNHQLYDPRQHFIVSNASCTTNCLAPLAKAIDDRFSIVEGLMTTIHAVTATQPTQDGPSKKDFRGGRNAYANIIPSSTGAAKAVGLVLPRLQGKLTGMSFRVPTATVSVVDLTVKTMESTDYQTICAAMKGVALESPTIVGYTDEEVVSSDFIGDPRSCIFDVGAGIGLNSNFFKLVAWYDNEWGYANRLVDLMTYMAKTEGLI